MDENILLVELLFPELLTESEHPSLSVGRADIKGRVEANEASVTRIEIVAVVDVFNAPHEPERHLEADVGLVFLLKPEVVLVVQIVPVNIKFIIFAANTILV